MGRLTDWQREELSALKETNAAVGMSFIHRSNWPEYRSLVRRRLVTWGDPPKGFAKCRFAGVCITPAGRAALAQEGR